MASERRIIPDLYFPDEDQELQTSSVEGKGGHGQGGGLERGKTVDLTTEGFIPIHKLTLEDLPECIRTNEFLEYILAVSTRVVKVNNNGLSDLRPDDDQFKKAKQKSLTGSGILRDNHIEAMIITNRHVLFNEDELQKSTFDVFYDYHHGDKEDEQKRFKRCVRTNGKGFYSKSSKEDIAEASYSVKDNMTALIKDHCVGFEEMRKHQLKLFQHLPRIRNKSIVACLISHPLGQPKQVSFGEMVNYDMPSRTVHYTAPSKPGSSGGRVIVFSELLLYHTIVHVGTELLDGEKYKYARIYDDANLSFLDTPYDIPHLRRGDKIGREPTMTFEEVCAAASESVEIASLIPFVPIFGAFLSREVKSCREGLDTSILTPCKVLLTDKPFTSYDLKQSLKKDIERLAQFVPTMTPFPSSNLGDASTLLSLLESQGPCYCQSIVKMMEKGVQLEDGTVTECFLSPYTAAAKMSSDGDVTWPWLKGRKSELDKFDSTEGCLLRKCLELADRDIVLVMLLLMIARANVDAKELHLHSSDPSSTMMDRDLENQGKTVHEQSKQEPRLEKNTEKRHSERQHSPPVAEKKVSSSAAEVERDWHRLTQGVFVLMMFVCSHMSTSTVLRLGKKYQNVTSKQEENEDISKLYSGCVAVSEHAWQHERQVHPDTERIGQDDGNVKWCRCGRPGIREVNQGITTLATDIVVEMKVNMQTLVHKIIKFCETMPEQKNSTVYFRTFIQEMQQHASEKSLPPGTVILTNLDEMESFPRGRHSLMLFLASWEALFYNLCLLARQIRKHFQTWYFAFPVSMFGRPGNWPGNVTPPEVQRTAWRLIQDAILASGFRPALLAALEKNAERREKLIDLYVDMKQFKWQGRIQPWLFRRHLEHSSMVNHLQAARHFDNPTHYFVWYASFLVYPEILTSQGLSHRSVH